MNYDERIFELLEAINNEPGLTAGGLLARCGSVTEKTFGPVVRDMKKRGLIVTTGMNENMQYHLTDSGRCSVECGELPLPEPAKRDDQQEPASDTDTESEPFIDVPVFGQLPEITVGDDEIITVASECEPMTVIDTDKTTLELALKEARQIAKPEKPSDIDGCIQFLCEFSDWLGDRYPAAAAMLKASASHINRIYQR